MVILLPKPVASAQWCTLRSKPVLQTSATDGAQVTKAVTVWSLSHKMRGERCSRGRDPGNDEPSVQKANCNYGLGYVPACS